jgi:dephospho-CoA kinase
MPFKPIIKQAIRVGLTGGIACGKSTVCQLFREQGIVIIDADQIAKQLLGVKQPTLNKIVKIFGTTILRPNGELNRQQLGHIVFNDTKNLHRLESILHPQIKQTIQQKIQKEADKNHYLIVDVPLLIEQNYQALFDLILVIDCNPEQQIQRAQQRDQRSIQQIETMMNLQVSRQQRLAIADNVLDNTGSLDKLRRQVKRYHKKLCRLNRNLLIEQSQK